MKDTKLIQILRTLSKVEYKLLEKFAASPYHIKEKNCSPMIAALKKFYPEFSSPKLTYEEIYKSLYPENKFNRQVMWNLVSAAERTAEEFLMYEALKDSPESRTMLLKALAQKKLTYHLSKHITKTGKFLKESKTGRKSFYDKAKLESYVIEKDFFEDKQHLTPQNILSRGENLILAFLLEITENLNDLSINHDMYNTEYRESLQYNFLASLDAEMLARHAFGKKMEHAYIIELCAHWLKMVLEPGDESHFFSFKKIYLPHEEDLDMHDKYIMTSAMSAYCSTKIYSGNKGFRREMFELNRHRLDKELAFYPEGQLPKNIYKQIFMNAVMLDEISWSNSFITDYTQRLKPEFQKPMSALARALMNLHLKKYDEVINELINAEYLDVRDKIHVKILTAQAYYELGATEPLLSHIDSAKHFLKNTKDMTEKRKADYGNFFSALQKLVLLSENPQKNELHELSKEVSLINNNRKWLLEKIDSLKKTR